MMNKYIKNNYEVENDSMTWSLLKTSAFFKEEIRQEQSELEIIDSYINCMEEVCKQIISEFRDKMCIMKTYSLSIPYLFICRHIIELMLKKAIEDKLSVTKRGHNILILWNECKKIYGNKQLDSYDELIKTIDTLDCNGEKFRYTKDMNGNEFENKPVFLNIELLKIDIIKLKDELLK